MTSKTRAPVFLNISNSLQKSNKYSATLAVYLFLQTLFINSIGQEHSCKILYFQRQRRFRNSFTLTIYLNEVLLIINTFQMFNVFKTRDDMLFLFNFRIFNRNLYLHFARNESIGAAILNTS